MKRRLVGVAAVTALAVTVVVNFLQAEAPPERTTERVAFDRPLRLKVEKVTPAKGPRGDELKLDVVRWYGKISRDSYEVAQQNESQRFSILFPVKPGAVVKPGDIIDYEYSRFLPVSDPKDARQEQPDDGGRLVDPNAEPIPQYAKPPPGPDFATLEGTLKVHPKSLYRDYLEIDGVDHRICALYGPDRAPSELIARFKPGSRVRVRGRLGSYQSRGSTPDNPSPFGKMWIVYMGVQSVEPLETK